MPTASTATCLPTALCYALAARSSVRSLVVRILRKPYRAGTPPSPTAPNHHGGGSGGGQLPHPEQTNHPNLHLHLPPRTGDLASRSAAAGCEADANASASAWGWGGRQDAAGSEDGGALELSDFSDIFTDSEDDTSATVTAQTSPRQRQRRQQQLGGGGDGSGRGVWGSEEKRGRGEGGEGRDGEAGLLQPEEGEGACDIFLEAVSTGGMEQELLGTLAIEVRCRCGRATLLGRDLFVLYHHVAYRAENRFSYDIIPPFASVLCLFGFWLPDPPGAGCRPS